MFNQLRARLTEDNFPRLHRIPFMVIWIASYGLSVFTLFFLMMMTSDVLDNSFIGDFLDWLADDGLWLMGMLIGALYGIVLSLLQTWAIRRRYGYVPRFWRSATIIGMTLSGWGLGALNPEYGDTQLWITAMMWFSAVNAVQALVLWRVNRKAWRIAATGLLAGVVGGIILFFEIGSYDSAIWAMLAGFGIQAIGTGLSVLAVMADPREGIVPKRDTDVKAKAGNRQGLHPMTFIGFWGAAYFMGWVMTLFGWVVFMLTAYEWPIIRDIVNWVQYDAEWLTGVSMAVTIGLVSSIAQRWLIRQQGQSNVRRWVLLSTTGWAFAGIGLYYYIDSYDASTLQSFLWLGMWFGIPALFQTVALWRTMRGGWIWIGTGLVTAVVAMLAHQQLDFTYNASFYAIMLGGIAQAIITGVTFIILQSQQERDAPMVT